VKSIIPVGEEKSGEYGHPQAGAPLLARLGWISWTVKVYYSPPPGGSFEAGREGGVGKKTKGREKGK